MPVSVVLWRVGIGIFNFRFFVKLNKTKFQLISNGMEVSYFFIFCVLIVLIICGNIELNPGPKKDKSCDNFDESQQYCMSFPSCLYLKPITLIICTTLYVSPKHT